MSTLFIDLDGTLINSQGRLYRLFRELCPECLWTYEEYWRRKRARISQADMLRGCFGYSPDRIEAFHRLWLEKVEEPERVRTDVPVDGMSDLIESLSTRFRLVVLTCRQNAALAERQLAELGWLDRIEELVAVGSKSEWLSSAGAKSEDVLIGDTGEDVRAARENGIRSVAVAWGTLAPDVLAEYAPNCIVKTVQELSEYLMKGEANNGF